MLSIIDKAYPVFSPPCGDCTQAHRREVMDFLFFAPLRGLYFGRMDAIARPEVFAPLRGLYFIY